MYQGYLCKNCNRPRVEKTEYGDVCEKCDWNQDVGEYNSTDAREIEKKNDEMIRFLFGE